MKEGFTVMKEGSYFKILMVGGKTEKNQFFPIFEYVWKKLIAEKMVPNVKSL